MYQIHIYGATVPTTSTEGRRRTVTRVEVVEAARDILDEDGIDGLTMATASGRVGLTTMGVYRHVKNRDDLVASAVALVLEDVAAATGDDRVDWLDGVTGWMDAIRTCLLALLGSSAWARRRAGARWRGPRPWRPSRSTSQQAASRPKEAGASADLDGPVDRRLHHPRDRRPSSAAPGGAVAEARSATRWPR